MHLRPFGRTGLAALVEAGRRGMGTIAKRPLAGRPWAPGTRPVDRAQAEYRRRYLSLQELPDMEPSTWDATTLRFAAYEPGVYCVIVGGTDTAHLEQNVAAATAGPLEPALRNAIRGAFDRAGSKWRGLV